MWLLFKNPGQIEVAALHLMGASTKKGDNSKIGMFGTGNKYALAFLLRAGIQFYIYSGTKEIKLSVKEQTFRDKTFDVIFINGKQTSLTTDMGPQWDLWKAVRELYCNAIDEGQNLLYIVEHIQPVKDETHIYVEYIPELKGIIDQYDMYFAFKKKVLAETPAGNILEVTGSGANVYRKGIRCYDSSHAQSVFDYDLKDVTIGEDRMAMYSWRICEEIWKCILKCQDSFVIQQFFSTLQSDHMEFQISSVANLAITPSAEVLEFLKQQIIAPYGMSGLLTTEERQRCIILPTEVFMRLRGYLGKENVPERFSTNKDGTVFRTIEPTPLQKAIVKRAMDFLTEAKFDMKYPVEYAMFDDSRIFGIAQNGSIILNTSRIDQGVHETVNTIVEEYIHLKYNVSDCSRDFQKAAIDELIVYMKNINALPI